MSDPTARSWPPLALLISLGLNCLLIGLMVGHAVNEGGLHGGEPPAQGQPVQVAGFGARVQALSPADKRAFNLGMLAHRPAIRQARQELAEARARLADAISRDPYDKAAAAAAFAEVRSKSEIVQERVQEAAADALAAVSLAGRRELVK
ncbi:MAG TPA: periplasmic heavy metal sensor [Stellaceae bacterium]|nr:periplasmic heavy metal sensor [Stellaceae bacterium]